MIAYKFLAPGAVGPFSGFAWPTGTPGPWVEAEVHPCQSGVHACHLADLPYWIREELWEAELDRAIEARHKLVAPRGRLLRRIDGWDDSAALAFSAGCAERAGAVLARSTGRAVTSAARYVVDLERTARLGQAAPAAMVAARIVELVEGAKAYQAERATQARWFAEHLGLGSSPRHSGGDQTLAG